MKLRSVFFVSALAVAGAAQSQSLYILRDGDGSAALSSAATSIFLDNYSLNGALLGTNALSGVTNSGGASSEGSINYSDGQIVFAGYNAAPGTASVVGTTSANVNRVVGTFNPLTGASTTSTISDQFSANNIRSAVTVGGTYYAGGGNSGLVSGTVGGSTTTAAGTTTTNIRTVNAANGSVYFATASASTTAGTQIGIYKYTPGTTTAPANQTLLVATGGSPYGFQFLSPTSLLVADDNAATGGIRLYTSTDGGNTFGATPTSSLTLTSQPRSLAVFGNTVYYTTAAGLFSTTLTGTTFGTATQLASAGTNQAFRGIVFVPAQAVPEPSAFAALGLGALALVRRRRSAK